MMHNKHCSQRPGVPVKPKRTMRRLMMLLLPFMLNVAGAGVYDAVVPLEGPTVADREKAFSAALAEVAVRASGQRDAAASPVVGSADAAKYVQRYSRAGDGSLNVGFDADSTNRLLREAGLNVWPLERPSTLVLMSVPAAATGGQAMRSGDAAEERQLLEATAQSRGIALVWPRAGVDVAAAKRRVESGDSAEIAAMLAGTGAQGLLVGLGSGEAIDWVFADAGALARARGDAASGAHLAADNYAARYAPASTRSLSSVTIRVGGIDNLYQYSELLEYLESLSMVNRVAVQGMGHDIVRLIVTLRGDGELLRRIAELDTRLQPTQRSVGAEPLASDYTFTP